MSKNNIKTEVLSLAAPRPLLQYVAANVKLFLVYYNYCRINFLSKRVCTKMDSLNGSSHETVCYINLYLI